MAKRGTYPPEFRRKILNLVRSGHSVNQVAREFEVARQSIVNWQKQDDLDSGRRADRLTTEEHKELVQLRRENKRLKLEAGVTPCVSTEEHSWVQSRNDRGNATGRRDVAACGAYCGMREGRCHGAGCGG